MPGPHRTAARDAAKARRCDAVELRFKQGMSYQQIADALGCGKTTAIKLVRDALAERMRETTHMRDALIGEQLAVIEAILDGLLPRVASGDSRAAEVIIKALDRHARLLGLDAPVRADVRVTDELTAQIMQLADELAGRPAP